MLPVILMIAGGVLLIGVAAFYAFTGLQPVETSQPQAATGIDIETIPRVSLADAKAAYDTGQAVFVDVREAQSYAQSHIAGALSIPLEELPDRITELNPSDWIITY